ncbi:MAG: phosphatase [Clostridiales bacterium]|nr:phosphatase [Clostridiales bacterium]
MICGIVDVGSNTIRLSLYRCEAEGNHLLMHRKVMAGLASYVEGGRLSAEGVQVVCHVLTSYRALLDNLGIEAMYVFATASLRNISNTEDVVAAILAETGLRVDVLSGEEEAALSFRGALLGITHDSGLMLDLGGGSTELLEYEDRSILSAYSLPIGSLNLFNRYVSQLHPTKAECKAIQGEVEEQLRKAGVALRPAAHICGVGGTVRAACKVANHFFTRQPDCRVLTAEELRQLVKQCKRMDRDMIQALLKVAPERIHTLVPGLLVLDTICQRCGGTEITVSACGVREGYLHTRVLGENEHE